MNEGYTPKWPLHNPHKRDLKVVQGCQNISNLPEQVCRTCLAAILAKKRPKVTGLNVNECVDLVDIIRRPWGDPLSLCLKLGGRVDGF